MQSELQANGYKLKAVFRGVSSTVKLSVSKTELGGSNPSAPARLKIENREQRIEIKNTADGRRAEH